MPFALPRLPVILCPPGQHTLSLQAEIGTHGPVEELCPRTELGRPAGHRRASARGPGPGSGSAPARREELQVPASHAPVAAFLARVAVSPVAAADVTPRGGSTVAFGVWVWKSRGTTCRGARKTSSRAAGAGESATAGVWERLKGRPRRG